MHYLVTTHFVVEGQWGSTIDMEQSAAARLSEISTDDGGVAMPEGVSVYARPFTDDTLAELVSRQIDYDGEVDISPDGLVNTLAGWMENMESDARESAEHRLVAKRMLDNAYGIHPIEEEAVTRHITDEQVSAIAQDPTVRRLLSEAESGAMGWRARAEQTVRAVLTAAAREEGVQ